MFMNDENMIKIIEKNINEGYINITNYDNGFIWDMKICEDYVNEFHSNNSQFDVIKLGKLSKSLFNKLKPKTDWNKIITIWEDMIKRVDYRKNVEHDDYTDDLDEPPTESFCYLLSQEVFYQMSGSCFSGINRIMNDSTVDAITTLFMYSYGISESFKERIRKLIIYALKNRNVELNLASN